MLSTSHFDLWCIVGLSCIMRSWRIVLYFIHLVFPKSSSFLLLWNNLPKIWWLKTVCVAQRSRWAWPGSLLRVSQGVGQPGLLCGDSGVSKLIQAIGWVQFLEVMGLTSLIPCWHPAPKDHLHSLVYATYHLQSQLRPFSSPSWSRCLWCLFMSPAVEGSLLFKDSYDSIGPIWKIQE